MSSTARRPTLTVDEALAYADQFDPSWGGAEARGDWAAIALAKEVRRLRLSTADDGGNDDAA